MPGDKGMSYEAVRFFEQKLLKASAPKEGRKIKFAQKSYLAFVSAVRAKLIGSRKSNLEEEYSKQFERVQQNLSDASKSEREFSQAILINSINYLTSIGVKLISCELQEKRLHQKGGAKPIKLTKGFIKNIKFKFNNIIEQKKEKSHLIEAYKKSGEGLLEKINKGERLTEESISVMKNPLSYSQAESKMSDNSAKKSLFANMQTKSYNLNFDTPTTNEPKTPDPGASDFVEQSQTSVRPVEIPKAFAETEKTYIPPRYDDFVRENTKYIGGVQQTYELPQYAESVKREDDSQKVGNGLPVSTAFDLNPSSNYISAAQQFSERIHGTGSTNAVPSVASPKVEEPKSSGNFDLESMSREELELLAARCSNMIREQEAKENHEKVSSYRGDDFGFSPKQLEEIERQEKERADELERQREAKIAEMKRAEAVEALINNSLASEAFETCLSEGIISPDVIISKMSDPTLTQEQRANLANAYGLAVRFAMNPVNSGFDVYNGHSK